MIDIGSVIAILLLLTVVYGVLAGIFRWYRRVPPNAVMVVFGRGYGKGEERRGFRIIKGGGSVVWPVVEEAKFLSLELMTINVEVHNVYTMQGVPVNVDGVAQVKIGGDDAYIYTAAEQLLGKTDEEIHDVALQTLAGHLRAILGMLTVEQIYSDRDAFAQKVQQLAADDMASIGLQIVSFTIKDIDDEKGYLESLGRKRTAEVIRDAQIGEALAQRQSREAVAEANRQARSAEVLAETQVAEAEKERNIRVADYKAESDRKRAEAELAYDLQYQKTQQAVSVEQGQVEVVKRQKQTEVAEQEALRAEKELDAKVKKPADAERYRLVALAEAEKSRLQTVAAGEAEASRLRGEGEAAAETARGFAGAKVAEARGRAEAEASRAQLLAKAEGERALAEARSAQDEINLRQLAVEKIIDARVQVAQAVAHSLVGIGANMKVVQFSNGGGNQGGDNALINTLMQIPELTAILNAKTEALTGHDVATVLAQALDLIRGAGQTVASAGEGDARPAASSEAIVKVDGS
jgi:flotillin